MKTKNLVLIVGKGTECERRITTNTKLYFSETLKMWVTVPKRED